MISNIISILESEPSRLIFKQVNLRDQIEDSVSSEDSGELEVSDEDEDDVNNPKQILVEKDDDDQYWSL